MGEKFGERIKRLRKERHLNLRKKVVQIAQSDLQLIASIT
jgi:hypothetical protein